MTHPTDDELIEHFCGDAEAASAARIEAHLPECAECRRAWDGLVTALTIVADNDAVPEPPAGFERVMWARVQRAIADEARTAWTWRQWVPAGALAAAVILGVALAGARDLPLAPGADRADTADAATADTAGADVRQNERVLYAALDEHFQQTEALLVELRNAPDRDALGLERVTADDLIAAGRLYRQTAEYTGHQRFVRMLDDLEPVLVEVARSPDRIDLRDRQWLRARIDDDNLLFKVRAVSNDVRGRITN